MSDLWAAPTLESPTHARVTLPSAKSLTNRLVALAALADGPSVIRRPMVARDTALMADALTSLRGLGIEIDGDSTLPFTVYGRVSACELSIDAPASSQFVSALLTSRRSGTSSRGGHCTRIVAGLVGAMFQPGSASTDASASCAPNSSAN